MSLKNQITEDMKSAMKAGEKDRLKVVRLIMAAIKQVEVDKRVELDDAGVLSVLDKMVKQRRDSVEQFEKGDREDLAAIERAIGDALLRITHRSVVDAPVAAIRATYSSSTRSPGSTSSRTAAPLPPRPAGTTTDPSGL